MKRFILSQQQDIQKILSANKSYDGYIALTSSDIQEVIEKIDRNFDVDTMIVTYILTKYPLEMYDDLFDLMVREEEDDG